MALYFGNQKCKKLYIGNQKVKRAYLGNQRVYSAGNIVTYKVDSNVTYTEEVDSDATCLSPTTFTPAKSGWSFVGWREDSAANGTIIGSKVMGDDPITLYAVFRQTVKLTIYNNSTAATSQSGYRYYNNANVANPTFTVAAASRVGWSFNGWASSNGATAGITYASISNRAFSASATVYARYSQTVTLTTYNGSASASAYTGTRYFNSGNYSNPRFTVAAAALSGWSFNGWCTSGGATAGVSRADINNLELSASTTLYGRYSQTIYLYYNGNGAASGSVGTQSGTRYFNSGNYSNPAFTLQGNGFGRENYLFSCWTVNGGNYNAGQSVTLSASTTAYAAWTKMVWSYANQTPGIYSVQVPYSARYALKAYGAQGGNAGGYGVTLPNGQSVAPGGLGGYTYGTIYLNAGTTIYLCVGGCPGLAATNGGYNGGGNAQVTNSSGNASAGGGATHIATANGLLKDLSGNRGSVLAVGGGGGGAVFTVASDWADYMPGGSGGGTNGGNSGSASGGVGWNNDENGDWVNQHGAPLPENGSGRGGTQTAGGIGEQFSIDTGTFGQGGAGTNYAYRCGGGGGGWFGGSSGYNGGAGAGGSGYVNPSLVGNGSSQNGVRSGNGYAEISIL